MDRCIIPPLTVLTFRFLVNVIDDVALGLHLPLKISYVIDSTTKREAHFRIR
jgi:hypothetical protein